MAAYPASNTITTELIQKYLDENKQLILAILDNQNLGKLNECAQYQLKLQQNLMYLAAIADAQPQASLTTAQVNSSTMMQPQYAYMQQQQQMVQQSMLGQRSSLQYMQQQQSALHQSQQQQQLPVQQGMMGGHNGMHMLSSESNVGGNGPPTSGNFPDFSRGGHDGLQTNIGLGQEMRGGSRSEMGVSAGAAPSDGGNSGAQGGDESEPSYLKASEEDGN